MQKTLLNIIAIVSILSCSSPKPETYIDYINGYWEIEKVVTKEGKEKQYNFNQHIDFFEVTEMKGVRKKVQPTLDGKYISTNHSERVTLKIENDSLRIYYKTQLATWKETIISAKENQMILKNEAGNLYFYKSHTRIQL
ncbi:lipocalin family protein [Aquimarina sp. RZ0]|uniref:lipocalin family protein n=1 Tax=Aquimarina sp. RZ0 TaxID=2607730 RepID=UPI0011F16FEA|nr:lipocalin family protein [Aquimarina sp. RZ0]KAA1246462.1 lipocalin family protein [Aquimarina sp. RZ0]